MPKVKLTNQYISNLKPSDKRQELQDEGTKGLALRLNVSGNKSFVYRYRFNDKVKRYTIGSYPEVSLAQARDKSKEITFNLSQGIDPLIEKRKNKDQFKGEITFAELSELYIKRHLPSLSPKSSKEYIRIINVELLNKIGKRYLSEISKRNLIDLIDAIAIDRGLNSLSNRVRSVLSSIYSFAVNKGILESNMLLNLKLKKKEQKRDRVYSQQEIHQLWAAFESQDQLIETIYKLLLLLGQRTGETCQMRWSDIDTDRAIWTIPTESNKAGRLHIVPLSEQALELILNMKPLTGNKQYVFNSLKSDNEPVTWIHNAKTRIKKISGVTDFRPHDLRRTMASNLAEMGVNRTILGKILNHKGLSGDSSVTAIYDRYDYLEEKREALENWSQSLALYVKSQLEFNHYRFNIRIK
jgi:integrase